MSEHNSIGKVSKIFALKSSSNTITDVNLQKLAFQRLQSRAKPMFLSLEEYYKERKSCHLVEVVETPMGIEYLCDCYLGIKGKL